MYLTVSECEVLLTYYDRYLAKKLYSFSVTEKYCASIQII